ncbi:P-loop containing nucleoside triphosphate hydrolase protein [Chytriomyces sp. MP71]|nr:P-loop containing nucleoside triphosphate hydrolase protein [Chytriomyces sp. MP71]
MACPAGFYCPDYNLVLPCPKGSFCLTGSSAPTPCQFLSICGMGTVIEKHYGILLLSILADLAIIVYFVASYLRSVWAAKGFRSPIRRFQKDSGVHDEKETTALVRKNTLNSNDIAKNITALTAGFHKGLEGNETLSMNYDFDSLSLRLPDGKEILQGVTGSIKAGRMTAIMGPSGAGKTTFMNVLMGRTSRTSGTLMINQSVAEMSTFRKIIGFVPQEDIMIEELTVRENIRYSARTRLPNTWTNKEVDEHVESLLSALNLKHVADKKIGTTLERGISGGQRKRVNIAMELAAAPLSVFLDEPTSGLDSTASLDVANILSSISRLGLTIVAVIHQPRVEIFEAFDDVLMIAPGGRTAYFGPVAEAKPYFENLGFVFQPHVNVADALMDILAGRGELRQGSGQPRLTSSDIVARWASASRAASAASSIMTGTNESILAMKGIVKRRGASFIRQIGLSHNRSITQQMRLISGFGLELFVGLFAGSVMGISSGGGENFAGHFVAPYTALSAAATYWFLGLFGMLVGITIALSAAPAAVKLFSEEKAVYMREAEAGHNVFAYFIGKNAAAIYRIVFSSAHFVSTYYLLSQPPIPIGTQYAIIFLNFFGVYGLAQIISMLVRRENAALLAVTIALIFEVLCGFGPRLNKSRREGTALILDVQLNRWGAEAQYALWVSPYSNIYDLDMARDAYGYEFGNTTRNLLVMIVIGLIYRGVAFGLLLLSLHQTKLKSAWGKLTMRMTKPKQDFPSA